LNDGYWPISAITGGVLMLIQATAYRSKAAAALIALH
jgi:hypothetical protein